MEVNYGGGKYLPPSPTLRWNNCLSIYHTSWIINGPKSNFICDNIPTKAILLFFGCSEVDSTWQITSEPANQSARKILFTSVVYTNNYYYNSYPRIYVTNCLLAASEIFTRKSQTETLPYWPNDSEAITASPRFEIFPQRPSVRG